MLNQASQEYFKQHNMAILQQQKRFKIGILRLQRENKLKSVSKNDRIEYKQPVEEDTRGTFVDDQSKVMQRGNTIAFPPCKSDYLNIYINNKLVNRSYHNVDSLLKRVRLIENNREKSQNESLMQSRQKVSMIIPYLEGQAQKVRKEKIGSITKLDKLHQEEMKTQRKAKLFSAYPTRKHSRNQQREKVKQSCSHKKVTEGLDTQDLMPSKQLIQSRNKSTYIARMKKRSEKSPDRSKQLNVESILRRKQDNFDFHQYIEKYALKMDYPEDVKLFIFKSHDEYIRRLLLKHGWVQNTLEESSAFHLKWTINDSSLKYNELYQGQQFFNHFPNSLKLTTKVGLHQYFYKPNMSTVLPYYSRSYDLQTQQTEFLKDFERTSILSLLKKHVRYFISKDIQDGKNFDLKFKQILSQQNFYAESNDENFQVNIPIIIHMCMYLYNWRAMRETSTECYQLEQRVIDTLTAYSRINPPYEGFSTIKKSEMSYGSKSLSSPIKKIIFNSDYSRYNALTPFATPSDQVIQIIYNLDWYFSKELPYYKSDGEASIWIIKGCNSSKGVGITLQDKSNAIIEKKDNKIAQKYVENCLIFSQIDNLSFNYLQNCKHDIRQWVLVRAFNPLQIYIYTEFYIRICSDQYDLSDIRNPYRHLTNYSRNKAHFTDQKHSVMHSKDYKELIKESFKVEYDKQISPVIKKIIIKSIKSYQGVIKQHRSCFQLYGYDFLLTSDLKPILLEVNLSPACSQRTPWMTQMLDQMGAGLLNLVLPEDYLKLSGYPNKWKLIFQD